MAIYTKGPKQGKRAKEVFSSIGDVCNAWALQETDTGRTSSGSVYFDGPIIYSYGQHYEMGYIYPDINVILRNEHHYSNSTSNHLGYIGRESYTTIDVPEVDTRFGHDTNVKYLAEKIENSMKNMIKAKRSIEYCAELYVRHIETYNQYVRAFDLKLDVKTYNKVDLDTMIEEKEKIGSSRALKSSLRWLSGKISKPIMVHDAPFMMRLDNETINTNKGWGSYSISDIIKVLSCNKGIVGSNYSETEFEHLENGSIKIGYNTLEKKYVDILKEQINFVESGINEIVL